MREGGGLHAAVVIHTKLYAPDAHPADCPIPAGLTARRITTTHGVRWHALAPPARTDKERNR